MLWTVDIVYYDAATMRVDTQRLPLHSSTTFQKGVKDSAAELPAREDGKAPGPRCTNGRW